MPESSIQKKWLLTKLKTALQLISTSSPQVKEAEVLLNDLLDRLKCSSNGPVLLLEDDSALREMLHEALVSDGLDVFSALNSSEALEQSARLNAEGTPFMVAIIALGSSSAEGSLKILPHLYRDNPSLKIILSSGNLAETAVVTSESKFWSTLTKPYTIAKMRKLVVSALC